jgi:large subunit ribosomal protein L17
LFKNLVKALILTEDPANELLAQQGVIVSAPKVKGRIITTLHKAKEVRPLVEKCITIARKGIEADEAAKQFGTQAEKNTPEWQQWRQSPEWHKWAAARAPAIAARRRIIAMLSEVGDKDNPGDKRVIRVLFDEIAPRFMDRPGGYTRILKLAKPRLGDAGARAILEFVGKNDRTRNEARPEAPAFDNDDEADEAAAQPVEAAAVTESSEGESKES